MASPSLRLDQGQFHADAFGGAFGPDRVHSEQGGGVSVGQGGVRRGRAGRKRPGGGRVRVAGGAAMCSVAPGHAFGIAGGGQGPVAQGDDARDPAFRP